jgi:uncharacterized protein (TIGR03437 family)
LRTYSALLVILFSAFTVQAQTYTNGQAARAVFGQTNFTAANNNPSQTILGAASGLAFYNGILYVADSTRAAAVPNDSRIVAFPVARIPGLHDNLLNDNLANSDCFLCGFPASFSLGQTTWSPPAANTTCPTGVTAPCFLIGRSQTALANATGVATDGRYFAVADTDNNRVLIWNEIPTSMNQPADVVVGQVNFTSFKTPATGVVDQYSLRGPQNVWIQNGKLFVADTQDNRVLIWNSIPTTNNQAADVVLGQPNFTTDNQPAPTQPPPYPTAAANQLLNPSSVTSDGTRLFVTDLGFNRVLIWNSIPTSNAQNADVVLGQVDMAQTAPNNPTVCASGPGYPTGTTQTQCQTSLNYPRFVISNGTKLFVADGGNDRVLIWDTIPTSNAAPANEVLGQPDFQQDVVSSAAISIASTAVDNTAGVDLIPTPQSIAYDPSTQNLFVSDAYNRRVLIFTPGDTILPVTNFPIVNWASEIIRQEGTVTMTLTTGGTITKNDTVTVTIGGTAYVYTVTSTDTLDSIAQGVVNVINSSNSNAGDPDATAIFSGTGTASLYLSSKGTNLAYDSISLLATSSNTANVDPITSGANLSSGTASTGALGMIVEINGTNLSDQTVSANLDGVNPIPNTLGGVQVMMDGYVCPIFKASPTQIVSQIPYSYYDRNSTSVYVRTEHNDGTVTVTNAIPVYIAPANPGIFDAPAYAGQVRPWPIAMAYHQPGNPTAVISIDGSVTAGNTITIVINGVETYMYTVVSTDTLLSITQNLISLINAKDNKVTASLGGAFTRIVLTAIQSGAPGNGIGVTAATSSSATVSATAYSNTTCCLVTPGSLITPANPAGLGEMITVTGVGLGGIEDESGNPIGPTTGFPYTGTEPHTVDSFVTATIGSSDAQTIFADLPLNSYGIYNMQIVVPNTLTANSATPLYVAQNAFISNTVTIAIGTPVLYTAPTQVSSAPAPTIFEVIDSPTPGATEQGTIAASGWALSTAVRLSAVNVAIDGVFYASAARNYARPDVCAVLSSADCPATGWDVALDTTQFADGTHTISITALGVDGSSRTKSTTFRIANNTSAAAVSQHGSIDAPGYNVIYRGTVPFSGWVTNNDSSITSVGIYVDGAYRGAANYGLNRPDVCAIYALSPNCPLVGWSYQFDTTSIADGTHILSIRATSANGQNFATQQAFQVGNWNGAQTIHAVIDAPSPSAGALSGTFTLSGWAVDDKAAVGTVDVSIDGVSYGASAYGNSRPDVCAIFADAGCPNVGFSANIDSTYLADGQHTFAITVNPAAGQAVTYTRSFAVANQASTANPIRGHIDYPVRGSSLAGVFSVSGWALSASDLVTGVSLLVDGQSFGNAAYGASRPDVCVVYPVSPACNGADDGLGWSASLNSGKLSNGNHVLEATVTTAGGHRASLSTTFVVSNALNSRPAHIDFDVPAGNSNPFLGLAVFSGWAVNTSTTVNSLAVAIDGVPYGAATYNLPRPDVCAIYPAAPNCSTGVGWSFGLDTTQLTDGTHTLGITENNADGSFDSGSITFVVANYSTANPMRIDIDAPANTLSYGIFGSVSMSGWAIDDNSRISAVNIAIDGVPVGAATYGVGRSDVCLAYPGRQGCPNVGWSFSYDTNLLPNGTHTLDVTGVTVNGQSSTVSQQFSVAN